jgi:hypothetical protein
MESKMSGASLSLCGVFLLVLLLVDCGAPTEPERKLVPGLIEGFRQDDPRITLGMDGTSLTIGVVSYGNTCREKGELRVAASQETHTVSVSPFDWLSTRRICDDILRIFDHSITVELEEAGSWTVVLTGQDVSHEPVQFQYSLDVGS